ncbi:superoxide dismutase [Pontibacter sp. SGAir0037]|uniref:superoxide dismutase n=1 Tax=Pontibacter sp. SGAir0037 TaxID=2571030 RepID=UPI0010CD5978|nr:superoxide dismutase [Pontibacter sp. SGAir0037]QCR23887.1 superoxide dismutase [Pontibacter sp. SGAir0037]
MDKRQFLKRAALLGVASAAAPFSMLDTHAKATLTSPEVPADEKQSATAFTLPSLPYAYDALEPHIDKQTMQLHHDKHHQSYLDNLNKALKDSSKYANKSIEDIMRSISANDTAIRNNGGGYYNHSLFWKWLSPKGGGNPTGKLAQAINKDFGSFDAFKKKFDEAATTRFGSGWAWLVADKSGKLTVASTPNQDNPLMSFADVKGTPVLGLDVWEHAYYLKYQNKRADYISAFWKVVNWQTANEQFAKATSK